MKGNMKQYRNYRTISLIDHPCKIMLETPHDHHTLLPICSLRFANKSDLCVAAMANLKDLTSTLVDTARAYEIEVSTENSKILTYSMKNFSVDTSMNIQKLKEVTNFKSLEQTCARVAPAQQRSWSGLPQQWQQGPD